MSKIDFFRRLSRKMRMGQNFRAGGKGEKKIFLQFKKQCLILRRNSLATFSGANELKNFWSSVLAMFWSLKLPHFQYNHEKIENVRSNADCLFGYMGCGRPQRRVVSPLFCFIGVCK